MNAGAWVAAGAVLCALSVAGGAFGAHALASRLDAHALQLWETAARYVMYGGFGVLLAGVAAARWPDAGFSRAALFLLVGALVFGGTVAALALGAPRWLGAVTPIGGLLLILGFLLFAWSAWRLS